MASDEPAPTIDHPAPAGSHVPPVGIDLGTTFSVLAYVDPTGRPTTLPNSLGDLLTPSAVFVDDSEVIVGREARKSSVIGPDSYAECFKRDMGYPVYRRLVRSNEVPPEVLSAFVLRRLKDDAELRLGTIRQAVITVPAFFDESRRRATQEAGRLAGLEVLDIINEPTAAAVAFGYQQGFLHLAAGGSARPMRVLVYDLGGGTFDVTILEISGTQFRALATDGDVQLGGHDFDERLVHHLAERFRQEHGVDPRSDPQDAAQLWLDAVEAKHSLSERAKTTVVCFHAGIRLRLEVSRVQFDEMNRDLLDRTETTTTLVLKEAGLKWDQVDRVLLVGGATRMPMVVEMLRRLTGKEPDRSVSPDEVVAHGAALYAEMLARSAASVNAKCELVNVNSHSLGVVGIDPNTAGRAIRVLIPKNTPLPARASRMFKTAKDDQRSVCVPVVEGESPNPAHCIRLGECVVRDLPPGLARGTSIEVEYRYGGNGCISVLARVPAVRQSAQVEIHRQLARNLATWKERLCRRGLPAAVESAASEEPVDPANRASVIKRLDALYMGLGKKAVGYAVPAKADYSLQMALAAATQLTEARRALQAAEHARLAAANTADTLQLDAALSHAREALHQAQVKGDFTFLVLGRDCVTAGFCPPGMDSEMEEIRRWKTHLERM
jgi:molecular chaperone DnaK